MLPESSQSYRAKPLALRAFVLSALLFLCAATEDDLRTMSHNGSLVMCVDHFFAAEVVEWKVFARAENADQQLQNCAECGDSPQPRVLLADLSFLNNASLSQCEVVVDYRCDAKAWLSLNVTLPANPSVIHRDGSCVYAENSQQKKKRLLRKSKQVFVNLVHFPTISYQLTARCRVPGTASLRNEILNTQREIEMTQRSLQAGVAELETQLSRQRQLVESLESALEHRQHSARGHVDVIAEVDVATFLQQRS